MKQQEHFEHIHTIRKELENSYLDYWQQFSNINEWKFWLVLAMFIIPLVVLYFKIDRSKIFLLGFFGYSIHIFAAYVDAFGIKKNWWDYPYAISPQLPGSIGIDASIIPVYFIFLYQWCLNKKKNHWLYGTLSAFGFTFIIKPLLIWLNVFQPYTNFFVLLLCYLFVIYIAKLITDIFIHMSKN
ncbi:CBO0543 family protein [Pseudalkalibacillus hwajinpoensis]|uniref:Uncharacterized protein n=1 Tax=Guptibacillus hwajinpoensis TaxID=208199 RepID=A0A4U1MNI9_9BACL|nr:CBO0543 family protein [Pseudalkalibacillus hwajinpoensis]TKD72255.1 hypothetical protein FBF83_05555 [Pseudalkalibacillus hwajinpoensis]